MADVWEAGSNVREMAINLAKEFHPDVAVIMEKIAIVFKEKASKSGGVVIPGKAKKAGTMMELLGRKPFIFILEIGADEWQTYSDTQRLALLDHLLCSCRVKYEEEDGGIKYFIAPPDFSFYRDEFTRHGVWQNLDQEDVKSDEVAGQIEETLGGEKSE